MPFADSIYHSDKMDVKAQYFLMVQFLQPAGTVPCVFLSSVTITWPRVSLIELLHFHGKDGFLDFLEFILR